MIRVLIVDDEVNLLRNLASYLDSFGEDFEVCTAGSGEKAIEVIASQELDLLLTDVRLPGIDGIDLVRRAVQLKPDLKVMVMTAFGGPDIRNMAIGAGALRFIEKPLDLEELRKALLDTAGGMAGWSGRVGGLDIFDFAQLLAMSGKTKIVKVAFGKDKGLLCFEDGRLVHASTKKLEGPEAFFKMTEWEAGSIEEVPAARKNRYAPNIGVPVTHLMMEAARLRDEAARRRDEMAIEEEESDAAHGAAAPTTPLFLNDAFSDVSPDHINDAAGIFPDIADEAHPAQPPGHDRTIGNEEVQMAIKDLLEELSSVSGFKGAAVFSPQGEMLESVTNGKMDIKTTGMFANNALLNAQKATDQMGVGRGNFMQIRAPQAIVLMRCLNEATDFSASAVGKAHFHTVAIVDPEGNVGMAGMILDKIVGKIADHVR